MKKVFKILAVGTLLFFASCNNPLDKPYNPETFMEDLQIIVSRDKANKTDMMNLAEYLFMRKLSGDSITETYRELIRGANEFVREREEKRNSKTEEIFGNDAKGCCSSGRTCCSSS